MGKSVHFVCGIVREEIAKGSKAGLLLEKCALVSGGKRQWWCEGKSMWRLERVGSYVDLHPVTSIFSVKRWKSAQKSELVEKVNNERVWRLKRANVSIGHAHTIDGHYLKWQQARQLWDFSSITDNTFSRLFPGTILDAEDTLVNHRVPAEDTVVNHTESLPSKTVDKQETNG